METKRARQLLPWLLAMLTAAGCSKNVPTPAPSANSDTSAPARRTPDANTAQTAAGSWVGASLHGNNTEGLRAYLRSVTEVTPRKFKLEWSPATVAFDRNAALRSLRSVSRDGSVIGIASNDPAVARLKPGSILWVWDVTVRKVQSLETRGDLTLVRTTPVTLNEAIPNAQIEFETPVNLSAHYRAKRVIPPDVKTGALRWRMPNDGGADFRAPRFLPASLNSGDPGGGSDTPPAATDASSADDAWYDEGMISDGFTGEKNGWMFAVGYQARAEGITLELQARKNEASDNPGAQLWAQVSDNIDARVRARVDLDGFNIAESLNISNGNIDTASTHFKNLNGKVRAQFLGRLGKPGSENFKIPVMKLPVSFNIPIPVGGIPFVVQVGTDFTVTVGLTGKNASLTVEGQTAFRGDGGFDYQETKASYSTQFQGEKPSIGDYKGFSLGVSAVVLGVQMPRLGLGLGLIGVSSVAYVDVINVITMTNGAAIGGLGPPCKRITYAAVGHVGIDTEVIPLPFAASEKVADALSPKREIFNLSQELLDPPVKMCEIH